MIKSRTPNQTTRMRRGLDSNKDSEGLVWMEAANIDIIQSSILAPGEHLDRLLEEAQFSTA